MILLGQDIVPIARNLSSAWLEINRLVTSRINHDLVSYCLNPSFEDRLISELL